MPDKNMEITIFGVLIGAVLPLFGYLVFHWLASSRDKSSRYANASNDFRKNILLASSKVPDENTHWDNSILELFPEMIQEIETSVIVFGYFLKPKIKIKLDDKWAEFKDLINNKIPEAQSAEKVMYSGGQMTAKLRKKEFHKFKNELITFANKT